VLARLLALSLATCVMEVIVDHSADLRVRTNPNPGRLCKLSARRCDYYCKLLQVQPGGGRVDRLPMTTRIAIFKLDQGLGGSAFRSLGALDLLASPQYKIVNSSKLIPAIQ